METAAIGSGADQSRGLPCAPVQRPRLTETTETTPKAPVKQLPRVARRNQRILADRKLGVSPEYLARKYGLHRNWIYRILAAHGFKGRAPLRSLAGRANVAAFTNEPCQTCNSDMLHSYGVCINCGSGTSTLLPKTKKRRRWNGSIRGS